MADDKLQEKMNRIACPQNCEALTKVKVNQLIWDNLSANVRSQPLVPLVVRFLKGVYESGPSAPRYVETWDVTVVLKFLATLHPPSKLTLRELTLKLVMLVSLVSGQRGQSILLMDINRSFSLSRNKKINRKPSSGKS